MTANADTGATRADTTGNGATATTPTERHAAIGATSHSISRAGIDNDDRRGHRPPTPTCGTTASVGVRCGPGC